MKTTNDDICAGDDITEAVTGEFPVLKEGEIPGAPHLNGASQSAQSDSEKAAFWLTHLETEVSRLHAKWHSIDAEFKLREERIAQLRDEVKNRDAVVEKLTADLRTGAEVLKAADQRVADKERDIAGLVGRAQAHEKKIADLGSSLGAADERHRALQKTLEASQAEVARLATAVKHEQDAAAGVARLNEDLLADQRRLQGKLQDLEIYVNGRHQSWSELNKQLADYKDALVGMERTLKARDASVARHDEEKRQLAGRILDLERQCSELVGRRKEREVAYDELQKKLSDHFEAMEQLKAEHALKAKETEQVLAKAVNDRKLVESLERGITRRDENIAALTGDLDRHKTSVAELSETKDKLTKRVDELDKTLHERSQQTQSLREELRAGHDQLQTLRDQLAERAAQLAESRAAAEEKSRLADKLGGDVHALRSETVDLRAELDKLEEHSAELGQLRGEALADCERLKGELAAQQELVASLETELRAKQATADLLERNVGRITDLGASLAALDRRMDAPEVPRLDIHFPDFVDTVATSSDESKKMLSLDMFSLGGDDVVDVGEPFGKPPAARKLVVQLGDEAVDYPLVKREMTIGRGHGSDIRIASHFISRIHAKVSQSATATVIEDAGSKNGILVNSERVQRRVLRDGDVVSLGGELSLRFVDAAP